MVVFATHTIDISTLLMICEMEPSWELKIYLI